MAAESSRDYERRIKRLKEEAAANEQKLRRSQVREMELLEAESLPELLNRLTKGLKTSFALDEVTLSLVDAQHEVRHLLLASGEDPTEFDQVHFVDTGFGLSPQLAHLRRPWLGPYAGADHELLFPDAPELASVALLPLRRQGQLVGAIAFGSREADRFVSGLATDFLFHLAVIAAFALENTVNRARLIRSGLTDVLTGWHNRRYLDSRLLEELARTRRDQTALTCLMIDVDHFKSVNDRFGHSCGDEVLREVAHRIELQVRASDISARYGGEEFVILLPHTDKGAAEPLAQRIRQAVSETPITASELQLPITVSIGLAQLNGAEIEDLKLSGERLLAQADVALYEAKSRGRDAVAVG